MISSTLSLHLRIEPLEPRLFLYGGGDDGNLLETHDGENTEVHYDSLADVQFNQEGELDQAEIGPLASLDSIPLLHSNPNSPVKLYLDFDGHFEAQWGGFYNVVTPVYDIDGDATTFSQQELNNIYEIWQRIAEDFAPFNVDVTTEEPPSFEDGVAMRASIGGCPVCC